MILTDDPEKRPRPAAQRPGDYFLSMRNKPKTFCGQVASGAQALAADTCGRSEADRTPRQVLRALMIQIRKGGTA